MWQIIIVILGLIFGFYLGKVVKEEIKKGRKYFIFFEGIILLILVLFFIRLSILLLIGVIIGLIICRFFKKIYFYLGILVGSVVGELFLICVSLVFLFGLFYGSLNRKNIFLDIIVFLIPFLLIQSFINGKIDILIGVGVGGVIEWARGSAW